MSKKKYNWNDNEAILHSHSVVKHNIIKDYLNLYFEILSTNPLQDHLSLTLIDGFAGGGVYKHNETHEEIIGSPFILLEAVAEAQIKIDLNRKRCNMKKFILDVNFIFIDKCPLAIKQLEQNLKIRGYSKKINHSIFLVRDFFHQQSEKVIELVKKKAPRCGRSIFILDQYGYKDIPHSIIHNILTSLARTEIILTFNIDSFLNFIPNHEDLHQSVSKTFNKIGYSVPKLFHGKTLGEIKNDVTQWRLFIQSVLYQEIISQCQAKYYTPFFVNNPEGYGAYWLIHMSQHPTARDAMTEVHWSNSNNYHHYGGAGLDMYNMQGFDPRLAECYKNQYSFNFDDDNKLESQTTLTAQLPKFIHDQLRIKNISFQDLYKIVCNTTPATQNIIKDALCDLVQYKEVEIFSPSGGKRRKQIKSSDIIKLPDQKTIFFMNE